MPGFSLWAPFARPTAIALALCLTCLSANGQEPPKQPAPKLKMNQELGITGEEPVKSPKPLVEVPAALADVIALLPQDPNAKTRNAPPFPSMFQREMARQSFWMAAHDDFGLRVRDASLGESIPDRKSTRLNSSHRH